MIFILHLPRLPKGSFFTPQHIPSVALKNESFESTVHLVLNTQSVENARLFTQLFAHRNRIDLDDIDLRKVNTTMNNLGVHLIQLPANVTMFESPEGRMVKIPVYYWNKQAFNSERVLL